MKIGKNISILVIGSVIQAATGCLCPENSLLAAIVRYVKLREKEVIIMDTQAGVEHFGRALAEGFPRAIIVTEPNFNSVQVATHAAELSAQLGIDRVYLVVNKVRDDSDRKRPTGSSKIGRFSNPFTIFPSTRMSIRMNPMFLSLCL